MTRLSEEQVKEIRKYVELWAPYPAWEYLRQLLTERDALIAENDRMQKALKQIQSDAEVANFSSLDGANNFKGYIETIARQALSSQEGQGTRG